MQQRRSQANRRPNRAGIPRGVRFNTTAATPDSIPVVNENLLRRALHGTTPSGRSRKAPQRWNSTPQDARTTQITPRISSSSQNKHRIPPALSVVDFSLPNTGTSRRSADLSLQRQSPIFDGRTSDGGYWNFFLKMVTCRRGFIDVAGSTS